MARKESNLRIAAGFALAGLTLLTRIPIRGHTLFEFDSIDFAVATFRFDLSQVTPHMPGYILHVLLGRAFELIARDPNSAFVCLSIVLSVGSVLFFWRAAAQLRGERVAIVAAAIWLTLPIFWFHGTVSSIYIEEAFWISVLLYDGLKLLNNYRRQYLLLFVIAFSLAGAARQNDLVFFLPAVVWLIVRTRPSRNDLSYAIICFCVVTAVWIAELLRESGGSVAYFSALLTESNFRSQSMLFGASFSSQCDLVAKVLFDLAVATACPVLVTFAVVALHFRRASNFLRRYWKNPKSIFVLLVTIPALLFYVVIFFMKAGYLLNVLPSVILVVAVLLDQSAIWIAERIKRSSNPMTLTRPIITRTISLLTASVVVLNILWFFVPWPGTDQITYNNENTRNSFVHGAMNRYEHSGLSALTLANRAFEYTNLSGIRKIDAINDTTFRALQAARADGPGTVILASWWSRWCYYLLPNATTIDIESADHPDSLAIGMSQNMLRENLASRRIRFEAPRVFLLLRHDRPDFSTVAAQVHLDPLAMPEYLDIYRITDTSFDLKWGDREFIRSAITRRSAAPLVDTLRMPTSIRLAPASGFGNR